MYECLYSFFKKGLETELEGKTLHEWSKIFLKLSKEGLIKEKKKS